MSTSHSGPGTHAGVQVPGVQSNVVASSFSLAYDGTATVDVSVQLPSRTIHVGPRTGSASTAVELLATALEAAAAAAEELGFAELAARLQSAAEVVQNLTLPTTLTLTGLCGSGSTVEAGLIGVLKDGTPYAFNGKINENCSSHAYAGTLKPTAIPLPADTTVTAAVKGVDASGTNPGTLTYTVGATGTSGSFTATCEVPYQASRTLAS